MIFERKKYLNEGIGACNSLGHWFINQSNENS